MDTGTGEQVGEPITMTGPEWDEFYLLAQRFSHKAAKRLDQIRAQRIALNDLADAGVPADAQVYRDLTSG